MFDDTGHGNCLMCQDKNHMQKGSLQNCLYNLCLILDPLLNKRILVGEMNQSDLGNGNTIF